MRTLKITLVLLFLAAGSYSVFAAPAPPTTGSPTCWPPPCVPIDGGVTFLIAAGAAYGAKKLLSNKRSDINS